MDTIAVIRGKTYDEILKENKRLRHLLGRLVSRIEAENFPFKHPQQIVDLAEAKDALETTNN